MPSVDFDGWPYPAFVAHRGAGLLAPENTLAAMRAGFDYGYRMFEFDAKLSGDGVAMLMHDPVVERTTDGSGRVAGMSWGEIARLDAGSWHSARFAGEPVPTLARVARWLRANDCLANIEIKPCPGREAETGAAIAIEARLLWREAEVPPLISSFSEAALDAARRVAPELPRALLLAQLPEDWLDRCRALGCVALDANHRALDAATIARARAAGLRVLAYTVNEPARAAELRGAGLDCVITDAIDLIAPGAG
ncbi:glycerophosphodiester phosphodiesterase [Burkholderiaceae bacterium FT117]|uniref:glycerophosphodiester phosphodiesterase n=1 Tax=Zeimonas sediminis TaxID=2944268 RepID=UPI002342F161|nr:glycerophosphodiester phosphodiesterase [Zeimonas sediminis]MCM5569530.1 glycerophosphodiester phosphodiesterase [Zeimonas sediminis]